MIRKQEAIASRQKRDARRVRRVARAACRLLLLPSHRPPASCSCFLLFAPALGRGLLVAALSISAYVLVRYWRSLEGHSTRIRRTLVILRATTLVLASCALAGLVFEYDTTTPPRILLVSSQGNGAKVESATFIDNRGSKGALVSAFKRKGFEVVEEAGGDVERKLGGFTAAALLTDGAMSPPDARREVERTSALVGGAPVYVVGDVRAGKGPSVALESVTALGPVLRGVPVAVRCTVHSRGMQGRESIVTVSDDAKVQASARIAWTKDDERQAATLTLIPKFSGWAAYSAKVEAAGHEDAARLSRSFTIYAEDRRLRVLFFEGEPTWESKFVRRALEHSGLFDVDYFAQVSRAAAVETSSEGEGQATGNETDAGKNVGAPDAKLHAILRSSAALNAYDSVVVGASPNALLSTSESSRLGLWVERRGGGLIILGGNSFNGSVAAREGRLSSLLPAEVNTHSATAQPQQVSQGRPLEAENTRGNLFLTPTVEGAGALAGYLNASEETRKASLTGQGFRLGALRPGATILAVAGEPNAEGTSEEGQPLIAAMNYGAGRTLIFAPADSWRMRTSASGEEDRTGGQFNALWQGIVIWASARARPAAEIVLSDESPAEGSEVTAEVRIRDTSFAPVRIDKVNVRLQPLTENPGDGSETQELAFAPDAANSSVWRGRLRLTERGRFVLQADFVAAGRTGRVEKQFAVVARAPLEPGASFDTLRRVSRVAGGEFITAEEMETFVNGLSLAVPSDGSVRRTWELRSWWPLAFLVPLLLSAEWFLRRWWRMD